jgi:uncharacterized linocin/CFP29 family protein
MNSDLVEAGWTDDHWNRIVGAVTEEAQRGRVAAQMLPVVGPEDPTAVAYADFTLNSIANAGPGGVPAQRLDTNNIPEHPFTTIAVQVQLTSAEVADGNLEAALIKFRRAANILARLEDAMIFNDRVVSGRPAAGVAGVPLVDQVTGGGPRRGTAVELGLLPLDVGFGPLTPVNPRQPVRILGGAPVLPPPGAPAVPAMGDNVARAIIQAMNLLEDAGQSAPFACALSPYLYEAVYAPNGNFVAAKDRILPILNGPLLRSSAITNVNFWGDWSPYGVVVALGGNPIAIRVAVDVGVRFVQVTEEPRFLFRVTERIGLRVTDPTAIAVLSF